MAVSFGLLSADWGNIADWATVAIAGLALVVAVSGVVVSLLGAAAVAYLGWQANSLASSAVRHELRRSEQDDELQARERGMILVAIRMSIGIATVARVRALMTLKRIKPADLSDEKVRKVIGDQIQACNFELPESVRSRLHIVGEPHCSMIVRAQTVPMALKVMLSLMDGADNESLETGYGSLVRGLATGCRDLGMVQEQCSIAVQNAGVPPGVKAEEAFDIAGVVDDDG